MRSLYFGFALAIAGLVAPFHVHAFGRADYPAAVKIYYTGSTSVNDALEGLFVLNNGGVCDAVLGNIDIWRSNNQFVITCVVSNDNTPGHGFASRAAGGTHIAFHKDSMGGSANAVNELIKVSMGVAHVLQWLDLSQLTNNCTVSAIAATPVFAGYTDHSACASALTPSDTSTSSVFDVHGGITEVDPPRSFPTPTTASLSRVLLTPMNANVLGVAVTTALYRALQVAQFGDGDPCDGSDAPQCVPSFRKDQLSSLFEQTVVSWNDFTDGVGVALPVASGIVAPTDELVRLCRRVAWSGAQAASEASFLGERCIVPAPAAFAPPGDLSTVLDRIYVQNGFAAGSLVNAAVSTKDVATCLAAANADNFWAMGVTTTAINDRNFNPASAGFRFVGIGGAAPTLQNVANGCYDFYTESAATRIASGLPGSLANGDLRREVIEVIEQRLNDVPVLAALNTLFDGRPWGNGGLLAVPVGANPNTPPYTEPELAAFPMSTQTRFFNACRSSSMLQRQPFGECECD